MRVKEVADLVGISVRTLHHYDEIGLLTPEETTESGYRIYSDRNLATLQQILFFKALDVPLKRIKEILEDPAFDPTEALEQHRKLLLDKRDRIDRMLKTLEKTLRHEKGEIPMTNEEKFQGFDFSKNPYEQEARERWGDTAVDASKAKVGKMTKAEQEALGQEMNALYRRLAELRHLDPASEAAQEAIGRWFELLNRMGTYSLEAFKGLGQLYVDDERFTKNIDQFGEGLAAFLRDGMAAYADARL